MNQSAQCNLNAVVRLERCAFSRTIRALLSYLLHFGYSMLAHIGRFSLVAILSSLLFSPSALAELDLSVGIASKYLREGASHTGGSMAVNSGLTWKHSSGFYLGGWATRLRRGQDDQDLETDVFTGFYQPLSDKMAIDLSLTRYMFHGDSESFFQDYNELGVSLLFNDRFKMGWRGTDDHFGTDRSWNAIDMALVVPVSDFNVEFYLANYRWLNKDAERGAIYSSGKSHYWHFRVGVERTWNNWDYSIAFERGIVGGIYDGGTNFVFGVTRHFKLLP